MYKYIKISKKDKFVLSDVEYFSNPLNYEKLTDENDNIKIVLNIENDFKELSEGICELIVQISKNKMLRKYIEKVYKGEDQREIDELYKKTSEVFESQNNLIKRNILQKVEDYIRENESMDIEGFINFRMKKLEKFMGETLDIAVEKYIREKEQEELTSLLRYFINIQEEKIELLKININKDKSFKFHNKQGELIKDVGIEEIKALMDEKDLEYDDVFINYLLNFCPDKIEIEDNLNTEESKQAIDTIRAVFREQVTNICIK